MNFCWTDGGFFLIFSGFFRFSQHCISFGCTSAICLWLIYQDFKTDLDNSFTLNGPIVLWFHLLQLKHNYWFDLCCLDILMLWSIGEGCTFKQTIWLCQFSSLHKKLTSLRVDVIKKFLLTIVNIITRPSRKKANDWLISLYLTGLTVINHHLSFLFSSMLSLKKT